MIRIQKRNGDFADFDKEKIINAINKAFLDLDGQLYEADTAIAIANDIEQRTEKYTVTDADKNPLTYYINVEQIQDWVEDALMRSEQRAVARAYIRHRYKREIARKQKTDFMEAVGEKLEARNPEGQNANVDECSFGGRIGEASRVLTKQYALDYLISEKAKNNHLNNRIYIHDLDSYAAGMHNCLSIPFDDLLAKGFNTRQADVRPANSINTACQYVKKSFYKHYIDGLTYLPWEDKDLAYKYNVDSFFHRVKQNLSIEDEYFKGLPNVYEYARALTERETRQGMEGLVHNLNTLQSRSGN